MEPTPEQTAFMAKNWRDLIRPRTLEIEERSETYGKFSCEPLERGFGTTLGVALRRILLSSLQGAAITHIAIEGALHEFTSLPGVEFDLAGRTAYGYTLVVLALVLLVARRVVHSPFGTSLRALRDNRLRAASIGLSVPLRLVAVYTLAGAVAGAAGALLAQTSGFASLDGFDFHRSAEVLLVLVIGGTGYLYGGIFGAIVFKLLHDVISAWTPQYWNFWLGLFLVVLVLVGRDRIVRPRSWLRVRRGIA